MIKTLSNSIKKMISRRTSYKKVFSTEEGKEVLADIYKHCGYGHQIHVANDPYTTAFNAGKHRVMQHIVHILNQSDEEINNIAKMLNRE